MINLPAAAEQVLRARWSSVPDRGENAVVRVRVRVRVGVRVRVRVRVKVRRSPRKRSSVPKGK